MSQSESILENVLLKKTDSVLDTWQERDVVLTKQRLFFGRVGVDRVSDSVPLEGIDCIYSTTDARVGPGHANVPELAFRDGHVIEIRTCEDGFNAGRSYLLKTKDAKTAEDWTAELRRSAKACADQQERETLNNLAWYKRAQMKCHDAYHSKLGQNAVAAAIVANFALRIVDVEFKSGEQPEQLNTILEEAEDAFTIFFVIELFINMFAHWTFEEESRTPMFFHDGWNLFDFTVVAISILSIALPALPGIMFLRLLRAFRVMRLFPRLRSLRRIINALTSSILPVANAFLVLLLFTCIYAVIAVTLFQEKDPVQFGTFSASVYSMFQVCTGDGWSTDIVRPLFREDGHVDALPACFFVSYILLAGYFLLNIVIAVLLDEFVRSVEFERAEEAAAIAKEQSKRTQLIKGALDPLLAIIFRYDTSEDLREKINALYDSLDPDSSNSLTFPDFVARVGKTTTLPRMHISREDWEMIMFGRSGASVLSDGKEAAVSKEHFSSVMIAQMSAYCQRSVEAHLVRHNADHNGQAEVYFILKQILFRIDRREEIERSGMSSASGLQVGSSREREFSASAAKASDSADVSIHETKFKSVETKVDSIYHKVDRLSHQMSMILQRLPADANEKRKSEGLSRDVARSSLIQQSNLQALQGFRDGIVESDVVFTLTAAAEIRSTVQELMETATGISIPEDPYITHTMGPLVNASNTTRSTSRSPNKFKRRTRDGTMMDSDSDSSDSLPDSPAAVSQRQAMKIFDGRSPAQKILAKEVRSPRVLMSLRKGSCRGCHNCVDGISVVGAMIYDQLLPRTMQDDHVQELKSICITRALNAHCNGPSVPSDVEAVARMLIEERLPSGTFVLNANAYVDIPTDSGRHVQRCFLVPERQ